ncbi:RING-H2 finger protein ATL29 [Populus nigra]|uniref:RING-H2 finger protein ATL29 n=1 Tax=Populus nigra TaxID=3691 RepID=UPI002B27991F|nr:RING-H2 finger protein ATL29 [Populus nigra]
MSSNSSSSSTTLSIGSPLISLLVTVILIVVFFIGFFSICFYRCFMEGIMHNWHLRQNSRGLVNLASSKENPGLDSSQIQFFPTFTYSNVKDYRREQYVLECAICLAEFSYDDLLRLLTVCYHVFHQECIDLWLEAHKTCPVCRRDLDLPKETLEKTRIRDHRADINVHDANVTNALLEHAISIHIREDSGEEGGEGNDEVGSTHDADRQNEEHKKMLGLSRSHSTGHSIVATREEENRYTLRLMEHVKVKITRGHCATGSCITFGDY